MLNSAGVGNWISPIAIYGNHDCFIDWLGTVTQLSGNIIPMSPAEHFLQRSSSQVTDFMNDASLTSPSFDPVNWGSPHYPTPRGS
jgi:hypothetical protein